MRINVGVAGHVRQFVQHFMPSQNIAVNPKRSRIRVFWDEENDVYVPSLPANIRTLNVMAEILLLLMGKNMASVPFVGLPVHPETFLKNLMRQIFL